MSYVVIWVFIKYNPLSLRWCPWRLKRKIWRWLWRRLQTWYGLSLCTFVILMKTLKHFVSLMSRTHCVENTLKLCDTYLFFILFRRFLFQLAHLLLSALQHRVRVNGSLDYAFRRLGDAFLNFWFLNFGFLGSQNVLPRPAEQTASSWVGKLIWLSGVWMVVGGFPRFLNLGSCRF